MDLLEKLPVEIQNKVYKFAHHPVASIFKNHIKVDHHRNFSILSIVKDLDNDNMEIKEQIVLEKGSGFNDYSISDKRLYENISKYNMYYDWVVFFYDSLYEQIKEDEDDTEFNYFYENFLEDKERHIKYALDFLKRIK
jgi:hypothetical protein